MTDKTNPNNDTFSKILNSIIEDKGGTPKDYMNLMNSIAYHESAGTLDPTIKQYGGGPGRGKYQFEGEKGSNRILSSAIRTKRYLKSKGIEVPSYVNDIITNGTGDASRLSSKEQDVLFLGDLRMKKGVNLKDYIDGKMSVQDLWADHWWAGSKDLRSKKIKSFNNSLKKSGISFEKPVQLTEDQKINAKQIPDEKALPKKLIDKTYQKPALDKELSLKNYMDRSFVNEENSKFNSYNTGGTHEQNPNGGIPQGMGSNGKQNTVEQGEASYDFPEGKFIFSDRVFVNEKIKKSK